VFSYGRGTPVILLCRMRRTGGSLPLVTSLSLSLSRSLALSLSLSDTHIHTYTFSLFLSLFHTHTHTHTQTHTTWIVRRGYLGIDRIPDRPPQEPRYQNPLPPGAYRGRESGQALVLEEGKEAGSPPHLTRVEVVHHGLGAGRVHTPRPQRHSSADMLVQPSLLGSK